MNVLIPASGLGSRLGNMTDYLPKALVRVGRKACISHIFSQYPPDTKFFITLGHQGNKIKEFVSLVHPQLNITFVDVDIYSGPKSSLLYSISKCADLLQSPFTFHCCDTIANYNADNIHANALFVSKTCATSQYRTVSFNQYNQVIGINEKGDTSSEYAYIGIAYIHDYNIFWSNVNYNIVNHIGESDVHAIIPMFKAGLNFKVIVANNWHDIGNSESLQHSREHIDDKFVNLDKDNQSVYLYDDIVVKFFEDHSIVNELVCRADILKEFVPTVINHTEHFFTYKKIIGDELSKRQDPRKFSKLLNLCKNMWGKTENIPFKEHHAFYINKTKDRVKLYQELRNPPQGFININGIMIPPVEDMMEKLEQYLLPSKSMTRRMHGDLHPENIIATPDGDLKFIDWRNNFAGSTEIGDVYYDLAKLNHGLLVKHDMIKKKLFFVEISNQELYVNIYQDDILRQCRDILQDFCLKEGYSWLRVEIITALIFLNIAALHHTPYNDFLYYYGRMLLYTKMNKAGLC